VCRSGDGLATASHCYHRTMSEANGEAPNNSSGEDRQFVHFSFYKLDRGFRLLPAAEREAALAEFASVVEEMSASSASICGSSKRP